MSKLKEVIKGLGLGTFAIAYFIGSIIIGLLLLYFGIKFIVNTGDRIFRDDKEQTNIQSRQPEEGDLRRSYVGQCQEEILKQAPEGTKTDDVRNYCGCLYDAMEKDAGGSSKFLEYQNTVSQDRVASITEHCRTAYNSLN